MPARLIILPDAESDVAEAYEWYEEQRPGLGDELLGCLDAALNAIVRAPGLQPVVHESYRRALVRRFPYAVFYEHREDDVTVYAVFHCSRDPAKWRRRLP